MAFLVLLNSICIATDRLILKHEKPNLYLWFLKLWDRIDSLKVPDLPRFSAESALALATSIFGDKIISIRTFMFSILLSGLITTLSIAAGVLFTQGQRYVFEGSLFYMTKYPLSIYAINYAFDIMTIVLAIACLRKIVSSYPAKAFSWSLVIIIQSFVLAVACYMALYLVWYHDEAGIALTDISFGLAIAKDSIQYALCRFFFFWMRGETAITHHTMWGFYACSTFIPLFIYCIVLLLLFVTKAVLSLSRLVTVRVLLRILENDPDSDGERHYFHPFTTLGFILTVLGSAITLLLVLANCQ